MLSNLETFVLYDKPAFIAISIKHRKNYFLDRLFLVTYQYYILTVVVYI